MAELFLICEGHTDGLDLRVLDLVIAQKLSKAVTINTAGGDTSLGSVATFLEEKSRTPLKNGTLGPVVDRAYSIEDRNYSSPQIVESRWIPGGKRFMWSRHEIENYLLDARIVARAFETLRPDVNSWPVDFPSTTDEVSNLLNTLAGTVLEHYVGWLTYWSLVDEKKRRGHTRIDWPPPRSRSMELAINGLSTLPVNACERRTTRQPSPHSPNLTRTGLQTFTIASEQIPSQEDDCWKTLVDMN
jgi:hypothetical protein